MLYADPWHNAAEWYDFNSPPTQNPQGMPNAQRSTCPGPTALSGQGL